MPTLATEQISPAGVAATYTVAAASQKVVPGPTTFLIVKNTTGSPVTITLDDTGTPIPVGSSGVNPDAVVSIPATTGEKVIGPLLPSRFANPADGLCALTWQTTGAGITIAVVAL